MRIHGQSRREASMPGVKGRKFIVDYFHGPEVAYDVVHHDYQEMLTGRQPQKSDPEEGRIRIVEVASKLLSANPLDLCIVVCGILAGQVLHSKDQAGFTHFGLTIETGREDAVSSELAEGNCSFRCGQARIREKRSP
jgi:hypothetical protein